MRQCRSLVKAAGYMTLTIPVACLRAWQTVEPTSLKPRGFNLAQRVGLTDATE